jgi:hypothetical protein
MASALPLCSEILTQDLQIAARALSFMERPLTGVVHAGIVYSAKDQRSVRQADELQRMLGRSARFGNLELRAVRVEIGEVARAKVDVLLLTDYIGDADARRADLSGTRSVPCVTTDIQQVRDGVCMMGIRSTPKVEILINRAAAAKSGVKFATVFRMLITEL